MFHHRAGHTQGASDTAERGGSETAKQYRLDDFIGVGHVSCDGANEVVDDGDDIRREGLNYKQIAGDNLLGAP